MKVGTDAVLLGCLANVYGDSVLEIGCGCGVIALMIAQRFPQVDIHAIDIHKPSVDEALQNFKESRWNNRLTVEQVSLQEFSENNSLKFDTIITNPPFFSKALQSPDAVRTNARHTTTLTYEELIHHSEKKLSSKGILTLIIPSLELTNFQQSISLSKLRIHHILHVFGADRNLSKRVILECGFEEKKLFEETFFIYNEEKNVQSNNLTSYSDAYLKLVDDFLLLNQSK